MLGLKSRTKRIGYDTNEKVIEVEAEIEIKIKD